MKLFPRTAAAWWRKFRAPFCRKPESMWRLWYTETARLKTRGKNLGAGGPCVSVANTPRLGGTPNEVKLKYLADNDFKNLSGEALKEAISGRIKEKKDNLVGDMASQGTTPRRLTDLIGSLSDLTSGSGDKGTR